MEGAAGLADKLDGVVRAFRPMTPEAGDGGLRMGVVGGIVHVAVHVYIAERYPDIADRDVCRLFHVLPRGQSCFVPLLERSAIPGK